MSNISEQAMIIEANLAPPGGWWCGDTGETIEESAYMLLEAGWDQPAVTAFLNDLISALRSEYGE